MGKETTTTQNDPMEIRSALIQQDGALTFQADYPATTLTVEARKDGSIALGLGLGGDGPHVLLSPDAVKQLDTVASQALWNHHVATCDDDE